VHVIDTQINRVVYSVQVAEPGSITSLSAADGWLYISEGGRYGGVQARISRLNIDPMATRFLSEVQALSGLQLEASYGIADMAVGLGGYMAITASQQPSSFGASRRITAGDVYIMDLGTIGQDGRVRADGVMRVNRDKFDLGGFGPRYVAPGEEIGQFIVTSEQSYNQGFTVINVGTTEEGWLDEASTKVKTVSMSGRDGLPVQGPYWKHRLNIQRAAGTAVVHYQGMDYAFVADFNLKYNDPWANYDGGTPKQIGGKIGVIQDPFGDNPRYLGATTPIVGTMLDHLIVTDDGKLLADGMVDESDYGGAFYRVMYGWNAGNLIRAALDSLDRDPKVPLDRIKAGDTNQIPGTEAIRIDGPVSGQKFGWTYGLGAYRDQSVPIVVDANPLPDYDIRINGPDVDAPRPIQRANYILSDNDSLLVTLGIAIFDGIIGNGYFERYDGRVTKYNSGVYGTDPDKAYSEFVHANLVDALGVGAGTVLSGGLAGKGIQLSMGLKSVAARVFGSAASGFAAGAVMEAVMQSALTEVYKITESASGQKDINWSSVLVSGAVGSFLGGALSGLPHIALFNKPIEIINDILKKMGELISPGASKVRLMFGRVPDEVSGVKFAQSPAQAAAVGRVDLNTEVVVNLVDNLVISSATRDLFKVPRALTLDLESAAKWYRQTLSDLPKMLDAEAPLKVQIDRAEKLQDLILNAAAHSLTDPNSAARFKGAFERPSAEALRSNLSKTDGLSGQALEEKVLAQLKTPVDSTRRSFEAGACFAAGTLVHTKEGLVPIEQIKVGDWVLSKPEHGGEQAYKRVLKTYHHKSEIIVEISYRNPEVPVSPSRIAVRSLFVTPGHPFWTREEGWTPVRQMAGYGPTHVHFEDKRGEDLDLFSVDSIYISDKEGIGWINGRGGRGVTDLGILLDVASGKVIALDVWAIDKVQDFINEDDVCFKADVFNIEVEDFHTYYVGEDGVWVHNVNCNGLNFEAKNTSNPLVLDPATPNFESRVSVKNWLKENGRSDGTYRVAAGNQSQVGLIDPDDVPRWLVFEEGTPGRLVSSDGVNWEYGAAFRARDGSPNYIGVEGAEMVRGAVNFVDRKLAWVKAGKVDEVMKYLERISERLDQNPTDLWTFEFNRGIRRVDLIEQRRAEEMLQKIRNGDADTELQLYKRDETGARVVDVEAMSVLRRILQEDRILVRASDARVTLPQGVLEEGDGAGVQEITEGQVYAHLSQARQYWLNHGASATRLNAANFAVSDLPLGWAARTEGTQITLDARAAGWGWFVDPTPESHSEFVPVSLDASEQARLADFNADVGSAAEGKLDLLTVLIHELGHVLGVPMPQSADGGDHVMSQYLQPGQRRLPDEVDIASLQALYAGGYTVPSSGGSSALSPSTVVGGLAVQPPLRYNGSRFAAQTVSPNSTLVNGDFGPELLGGWLSEGDVGAHGNNVVLRESAAAQSGLSQAFMVGARDRALRFTVSGNNLRTNTSGPGDAFEAALLNANTGLPALGAMVGTTAQTRTDALLNIQADGTESRAQGLRKTINADGSATYTVDLPAALAGTPVYLSFDLLGFGAATSSVSLRDVRLITDPLANVDAVTLDEDTPVSGNVLLNDETANAATSRVALVDQPMHGALTLNANGSFSYVPAANFYGVDAFSYRIVEADGAVSNTATVSLTVRPVNDAPVLGTTPAADVTAGQAYTFNALANASDVEGSALTVVLAQAPAHGTVQLSADGQVTYVADVTYAGTDSFALSVSDGGLLSAPVSYSFNVVAANTAPVAQGASLSLQEDGSLVIDLAAYATDAQGDTLTFQVLQAPAHGNLVQQAGGSWLYTPAANFHGADAFTWQASDGRVLSNVATVTLNVTAVNDAPTVQGRTATVRADSTFNLNLLDGAVDVDGDALTPQIVTAPTLGTLVRQANGSYVYTPNTGSAGHRRVHLPRQRRHHHLGPSRGTASRG
jgi:Bacterial Ig domain/Hint domain